MATAAELTSAGRRRPALDGLRGSAALAVLFFHAIGIYAGGSAPEAWVRPWVGRLDVGVPVFFVLSGFLLYRPFVAARREGRMPGVRRYAWHRALRILPGYWVALLVAAVVLGVPGLDAPGGVVRLSALLQPYARETVSQGLPQAWTLGIEAAFYVFLPLWGGLLLHVAAARRSRRSELGLLAALALVSVAWKAGYLALRAPGHVTALDPWLIALPAYLDVFVLGMAVAVVLPTVRRPWAWWTAAAALFAFAAVGAGLDDLDPRGFTHGQALVRHALYAAIALCCLVPATAGRGLVARGLAAPPMRRLGRVSYGVYLYHLTVLGLLGRWHLARLEGGVLHPYLLWGVAALAGTLVLAELSWRLVEAPALRLKDAVPARRRRAPAGSAPGDPAPAPGPAPPGRPADR